MTALRTDRLPDPGPGALWSLDRAFRAGVAGVQLPGPAGSGAVVTEADLSGLPRAAQRYLRRTGVVGRPRDRSFEARFTGRFRRRGQPWMPMELRQYDSGPEPVRLALMRMRLAGLLPMVGWDTYLHGRGRMAGKLLGLVPVADGSGPEFDVSELVTWLDDVLLLAPSMLLDPRVTWSAAAGADDAFDVALDDAGHRVSARAHLDADGLLRAVSTEDRWADLPGGLVRARWTTPVTGWQVVDGRPLPTGGAAVWHLPDGDFCYAEMAMPAGSVRFDAPVEV